MSELTELELARLAEARKWRPGDHVGCLRKTMFERTAISRAASS